MPEPLDLDALERLAKEATPGPWAWRWEDASLQWLHGPREEFDHVLSVSPCKACQARAEDSAAKGKAICLGPSPANAAYIAAMHPQQVLALLARLRAAEAVRVEQAAGIEAMRLSVRLADRATEEKHRRMNEFRLRTERAEASLAAKAEEIAQAMIVLAPNMPESGLVDACKQVKQVAISEAGNCETLEARLRAAEQTSETYHQAAELNRKAWEQADAKLRAAEQENERLRVAQSRAGKDLHALLKGGWLNP